MNFQRRNDALRLRRGLVDVPKLCAALGLSNGAKRQARGLLVLCPWHAEKHASCSVTLGPDGTVRAHCFTCQASGDALALIARVRDIDIKKQFRAVLEEAARIAGSERRDHYGPVNERGHRTLDATSQRAVDARLLELCPLDKERTPFGTSNGESCWSPHGRPAWPRFRLQEGKTLLSARCYAISSPRLSSSRAS